MMTPDTVEMDVSGKYVSHLELSIVTVDVAIPYTNA